MYIEKYRYALLHKSNKYVRNTMFILGYLNDMQVSRNDSFRSLLFILRNGIVFEQLKLGRH